MFSNENGTDGLGVVAGVAVLFAFYVLIAFMPMIVIMVRRIHDSGNSGWMFLLTIIPYVGFIPWIILEFWRQNKELINGPLRQTAKKKQI
ncbi:MAG: uncharacterized membrane protein YhaH (DUF805 family) [Saprospiraceae bacterium]|jgi:uncharacterized membrane protein YhaH (DUF805 family)